MNNRDEQVIKKVLAEIAVIEQMLEGLNYESFLADERTKRAVCMTLINIGELVKNLTEEFKVLHNSIPWRSIAGLRDVTAHKYQTLKMNDVWVTIKNDIASLGKYLLSILN